MAQTYTRQSSFSDGDTITAGLFNDEYNQLVNAFSYSSSDASSTGHRHDGTAGQGGNIHTIGDLDFLNKIVVDSTNNRWGVYVEVSGSAVEQVRIQDGAIVPVTDNDIDLGTSSLEFKDLYLDGTATIDTLAVDANATVAGTLGVTGATTLSSTLAVTGTSTLTGNVTASNDLSVGGNLTVTGNATIAGNLTFGDAATDTVAFSADVASNLLPSADNTYDLGASGSEWKDLYIDGTANIDSLVADTADINAGTIDNATIGATTASTGAFTTITASSTLGVTGATTLSSTLAVTDTSTLTGNVTASNDLSVGGNLTVTGNATIAGNLTFGDAATDTVTLSADVASNILPSADDTYDLGASGSEWKDIYIDGTAYLDAINFNGTAITATAAELNILDGVTATAAELNILDGVTSTAAELNILDGVTSTAAELNLLDGVTATTAELNYLDVTTLGTVEASKAVTADANADVKFGDSDKLVFGASSDLQIYHDGTHSYVSDQGTGSLKIRGSGAIDLEIADGSEYLARFLADDSVQLYFNGSQKLATKSGGIEVTDTATVSGATPTLQFTDTDNNYDATIQGLSGSLVLTADSGAEFGTESIQFKTGATERVRIDASGNVGIGTTSPSTPLHINTNVQAVAQLESAHANGSYAIWAVGGTKFGDVGSNKGISGSGNTTDFMVASRSTYPLILGTGSTERMRINSSGNVKIGTGTDRFSYLTASAANLQIDGGLVFEPGSGNNAEILNYRTSAMIFGNGGTEDMRIDPSGNVGIGTSSVRSGYTLDVQEGTENGVNIQAGNAAADIALAVGSASTADKFVVTAGGDVGIGTTSPSGTLHVKDTIATVYLQSDDGQAASVIFGDVSDETRGRIKYSSSDDMVFEVNNLSEAMRIASDGTISIKANAGSLSHAFSYNENGGEIGLYDDGGSQATLIDQSNNATRVLELINGSNLAIGLGAANTTGNVIFYGAGLNEAARIDASSNLLIGKTATGGNTDGMQIIAGSFFSHVRDGGVVQILNRKTSDGDILQFEKDNSTTGSIGTVSGYLYVGGTAGNDAFLSFGADGVRPATSAGAARDAAIDLGGSTNRFKDLYLSGGAYIGGTGAANYLDDYEEGSWTPVPKSDGTTITTTVNGATYTKIGRYVFVQAYITRNDAASLTGTLSIFGLPFNTQSGNASANGSFWIDNTGTDEVCTGYFGGASSSVALKKVGANNDYVTADLFQNSRPIYFSAAYMTAT